jgi:hypothetical protein
VNQFRLLNKILCLIVVFFVHEILFAQEEFVKNNQDQSVNLQGEVPRIEFDSTKFNFGDIYRGSVVSHSFVFQNTGNGVLILNGIHAACGCLNTKVYGKDGKTLQNSFQPNESGVIKVDFDTAQFSGNIVRAITAETNMGTSFPTITLTLMANVLQEISANPALLYIGSLDKKVQKTFSISMDLRQRAKEINQNVIDLSSYLSEQIDKSVIAKPFKEKILNDNSPLSILAVESSTPAIEARILSTNAPNVHTLQIKLNDDLPIGSLNAKITVWNNSRYYKNFQIPIVGEILGGVSYSAKYIEFGVVSEEKPVEKTITYSSSMKDFAITSVKINMRGLVDAKEIHDSEIFEIKKEKSSVSKNSNSDAVVAYRLKFKLKYPRKLNKIVSLQQSSGVNVSGNFLVQTNDPDYKEIIVPFFGILQKGSY